MQRINIDFSFFATDFTVRLTFSFCAHGLVSNCHGVSPWYSYFCHCDSTIYISSFPFTEHDLINWKLDNHRSSKQGIKFNNATIIIPTDGFYFVYSRVAFSVPSRDLFRKNSRLNSVDIQHSLRKRRLNHEFEIVQDASINCANHSFVHSSYLQRALYLRGGDELKVTISNAGIRQYQPSYGNENCFGIFRLWQRFMMFIINLQYLPYCGNENCFGIFILWQHSKLFQVTQYQPPHGNENCFGIIWLWQHYKLFIIRLYQPSHGNENCFGIFMFWQHYELLICKHYTLCFLILAKLLCLPKMLGEFSPL